MDPDTHQEIFFSKSAIADLFMAIKISELGSFEMWASHYPFTVEIENLMLAFWNEVVVIKISQESAQGDSKYFSDLLSTIILTKMKSPFRLLCEIALSQGATEKFLQRFQALIQKLQVLERQLSQYRLRIQLYIGEKIVNTNMSLGREDVYSFAQAIAKVRYISTATSYSPIIEVPIAETPRIEIHTHSRGSPSPNDVEIWFDLSAQLERLGYESTIYRGITIQSEEGTKLFLFKIKHTNKGLKTKLEEIIKLIKPVEMETELGVFALRDRNDKIPIIVPR